LSLNCFNKTAVIVSLVIAPCVFATEEEQSADVIYSGGDIVTMNPAKPEAEALAIRHGSILAVGSREELERYLGVNTREVDLQGKTLLPGFIDAHGHFGSVGLLAQSANVSAPPDGDSTDINSIIARLKAHAESPQAVEIGWILGMNYDDSQLVGKQHPTAKDLDKVSTQIPVMIIHQSGHLGVVNSKGLELLNYSDTTPNPPGGLIRRVAGGEQPNGVLEESALFSAAMKVAKPKSQKSVIGMMSSAQKAYVAAGFTTAQEGRANADSILGLAAVSGMDLLDIDVVLYADPTFFSSGAQFATAMSAQPHEYIGHYRFGGMKLSLDGSPQGKTAWLVQPYHIPPQGQDADYAGYAAMKVEDIDSYLDLAYSNRWQVLVHSNGDAASDQFISALSRAKQKHPNVDVRPVIIHAQVIREDQLDAVKELDVIPSFMTVHSFYWGDWHRDSVLGEQRAARISPAKSALKRDILYTAHNDAPVTLPNAMMILSSQVNRTTRSARVLGEAQRVSVMAALKSITSNAAYQYFEEDSKGSLEVGKLADLVILDKNPLKIDPSDIMGIRVLETIKEGKSVFNAVE
jgi:predicted amidohydrolase YtcJ